jgi:hypothetical protein
MKPTGTENLISHKTGNRRVFLVGSAPVAATLCLPGALSAAAKGWTVVSMKNDWKAVFPKEVG